jgi:hypothetical protein
MDGAERRVVATPQRVNAEITDDAGELEAN